jgi:hypothetical protein
VYPKNNNALQLNYRSGKWNFFTNYNLNLNRYFTKIYAFRRYFDTDGKTVISQLEQPSMLRGKGETHSLRAGADYSVNAKTNLGIMLSGLSLSRKGSGNSHAGWMDGNRQTDSLIQTFSKSTNQWQNAGVNLNMRHTFTASHELTADVDFINYRIGGNQYFENVGVHPSVYTEASRAELPSKIRILSAKADYTAQWKSVKMETGWKSSIVKTDNLAQYEMFELGSWGPDLGRSNHFLYTENIHAVYGNAETRLGKWSFQGGLRYERTNYDAHQLGNAIVKDSAFSRSYHSLFPTFFASVAADSSNSFSISAGRRIDRPAFQKLNPFVFIINKYTYQQGNPYYQPQFTWNLELSHLYKDVLTTSLSYSITKDYFSQIFPLDSNGIVIYTEGNLGKLRNFGASVSLHLSPATWWTATTQAVLNHKRMEGVIGRQYFARVTQYQVNINNQFRFEKGWGGEISGFYVSRSQADIQEIVDPAGQLSAGISKQVWKNKGTLKLAVRDIFYTQWMKGNTVFEGADEYFKLTRDTRVLSLAFTWRFGKAFKTTRRSQGAAGSEIERVGNG